VQGPRIALDLAHAQGNPANQVAASNLLEWLGLDAWDTRVEAAVAVLIMGTAWFAARRGIRPALTVAGLGYALAVSFNPYVFRYYYVAGLLLAAIGLTASGDPSFGAPESNAESGVT
jgi:hypothetical protein